MRFIWRTRNGRSPSGAAKLKLPVEATRLAYKDLNPDLYETGAPNMENLKATMREILDNGAIKEPMDPAKVLDLRFLPR